MNTLSSLLNFIGRGLPPVGTLEIFAGDSAKVPQGWMLCDGSAISRTDYPKLFAVIGEAYGAGDGSTTFNIPNMQGRVPVGVSSSYELASKGGAKTVTIPTHTLTVSEMPSHTHTQNSHNHNLGRRNVYAVSGSAVAVVTYGGGTANDSETGNTTATNKNTGGGNAHGHGSVSTLQPYTALNYIIKAV